MIASPDPSEKERRRRNAFIAWSSVIGGALLVFLALYVHGTRCTSDRRNAGGADAGCKLVCGAAGAPKVECVIAVPKPPSEVEKVITAYDRFPQIFQGTLWRVETFRAEPRGEGQFNASGTLKSPFGRYPIEIGIEHRRAGQTFRVAWLPAGSGQRDENAGSWEIRPDGREGTEIVYSLSASAHPFPQFLVNDALLFQLPEVLELVRDELGRASVGHAS